ncbi:phosphatase PAP2 family protein [Paenibacillus sp. SYP-B3998]|uniref:Phosphatase PAP2 family protein n=1 Tax=Paenibacillus sp. SYP-B3998 TaxID=2678564 RepID=A0A6G3ZX12_9BACL|nr:phosphatase PAP2 family protein [Paenibacillus sp. SYP-B3998]NEW06672.1 phosphatase PAP2 family protein [Paenibacillus sp. SYP-B3998]
MSPKLKVTFVFIISIFSFLIFLFIASLYSGPFIKQLDASLIAFVQGMEAPWLTVIMKSITFIGSTATVIIVALISMLFLYKILHHRLEITFYLVVIAGTAIFNQVLKLIFHRERPSLHRLIAESGFSFPSGHSMEAFALYASLAFLLWRHLSTRRARTLVIVICIGMIGLIGLSRIYLGVHYPSDVLGAYFASGFWFTLSVWIFQWYKEYRTQK